MLNIVRKAVLEKRSYVELALHSSDLMPGGSPTFPDERGIESLYQDLEVLFEYSEGSCRSGTLHEFYKEDTSVDGEQKS